ncbi:MAG: hypothetical protein OXG82_20515 [Gammaproteobacteria bacterium]|nr:hypothetical protein [Gammaproteobacteria bacterium]
MRTIAGVRTVTFAELRSDLRLARTWLYASVVIGTGLFVYLGLALVHREFSATSASVGLASPRVLVSWFGFPLVLLGMAGATLLGIDSFGRDQRDRIEGAIHSRPVSNSVLLAGQILGVVTVTWLPIAVFAGLTLALGGYLGESPGPTSMLSFLLLDALPLLSTWSALFALLGVGLRNRFAAALASCALLGFLAWSIYRIPAYLLSALPLGEWGLGAASEVVTPPIAIEAFVQVAALLLGAAGLLTLTAAAHPRPDDRPARRMGMGTVLILSSALCVAVPLKQAEDQQIMRGRWLDAHLGNRDARPPQLLELAGNVRIEPGETLVLDLQLRVAAPPDHELSALSFSLNPGMAVASVDVDGEAAPFDHALGLLTVALAKPLAPASHVDVALRATGVPKAEFAYLDSAVEPGRRPITDALAVLGTEASLFDAAYVALMPDARWLPSPGVNVGRHDFGSRGAEFFELDLDVEVPVGWWVAGPGREPEVAGGSDGFVRFRLAPPAGVGDFGLFASRFARRTATVRGVTFELLLTPSHASALEPLAELAEDLVTWLEDSVAETERLGIPYSSAVFSVVEVPAQLRVYGGGTRLDTVQALPGVLLLREQGLPTARFDRLDVADLGTLTRFFKWDITGGDVFPGATRNLLGVHTGAAGPGATALDALVHELAWSLLFGRYERGWLSAHRWAAMDVGDTFSQVLGDMLGKGSTLAEAFARQAMARQPIWDLAADVPLSDVGRVAPGHATALLALKGTANATALTDTLGRERIGEVLAVLRHRHGGQSFSASDLAAIAPDFDATLGDWLTGAGLPGFTASAVEVARLPDDNSGLPRYRMRAHVRNDEATPGLFTIRYVGSRAEAGMRRLDPIRVDGNTAVELGWTSQHPPAEAWLVPYLSQNRGEVTLDLVALGTGAPSEPEFVGVRPSDWLPWPVGVVIVDDLDAGFSIAGARTDVDRHGLPQSRPLDQGLPIFDPFTPAGRIDDWSRLQLPTSWGKYRRTVARSAPGSGAEHAMFVAELPTAGSWRLDYHLPALDFGRPSSAGPNDAVFAYVRDHSLGRQGTYFMTLQSRGRETVAEFDASAGQPGWNPVVQLDMPAGPARVAVSNRTTGRTVVADAIRWTATRLDDP